MTTTTTTAAVDAMSVFRMLQGQREKLSAVACAIQRELEHDLAVEQVPALHLVEILRGLIDDDSVPTAVAQRLGIEYP